MIKYNTTPDTTLENEVKDLVERLTIAGAVKDAVLIQNLATMAKKNTLTTPFGEIFVKKVIEDIYHSLYISILTPQGDIETIACIDYDDEEKAIDTYAYYGNDGDSRKVRNRDKDIQKEAGPTKTLAIMDKKNTLTTPFGEIFVEKSIDDIYHNLYISILTPQGYNETIACIDYNDEEKTIDTYAYRGNEEEWVAKVRNWDKDIQKEADELIAEVQNQIEICTDVVANHIAE